MPFLILPPPRPPLSPYWNGTVKPPLSNWNSSHLKECFLSQTPPSPTLRSLMQTVRWGSPLCPKRAAETTLQRFPSKRPYNQISHLRESDTSLLSFSPTQTRSNKCAPPAPLPPDRNTNNASRTTKSSPPVCLFPSAPHPAPPTPQFLRPGLHPCLLHPTSSSSSPARGSFLLFCCSSPACAVREEEWDSM